MYSIAIHLHEEDTLDNDEHEIIDLDVSFPNILSIQLSLTSSLEYHESHEGPYLDLAIVPSMLDISPLIIFPPSLNTRG